MCWCTRTQDAARDRGGAVGRELLDEGVDIGHVAAHVIGGDKYELHEIAVEKNVARRQLNPKQKRTLVASELRYLAHKYEAQGYIGDETRSWDSTRLAKYLGVSVGLVRDERKKLENSEAIPVAHKFVSLLSRPSSGESYEATRGREGMVSSGSFASTPSPDGVEKPEEPKVKLPDGKKVKLEDFDGEMQKFLDKRDSEIRKEEQVRINERIAVMDEQYAEAIANIQSKYGITDKPDFLSIPDEAWYEAFSEAKSTRVKNVAKGLHTLYGMPRWMGEYLPGEAVAAIADFEDIPF